MKIEIRRLELTNFKCFRHREFTFDSDVTTIRGRNGVGKTTIADAILWCFFGKNSAGQTTFDLKTHDADGRPIPNLDHSVEMVLHVAESQQPKEVTLRRSLKETWVKKRGSEEQVFKNNTTEYFVNGEAYTAKDYEKYISTLISEDIFRAITNPSYFPSLKWQQQREFLSNMVGDITPEPDNVEFVALLKQLTDSNEDIIAHRKHISYQIKQIKDKLDRIPVRLEEQHKALPERLDWDDIRSKAAAVKVEYDRLSDEIVKIKSGNGGDVLRTDLRVQIENVHRDLGRIEETERRAYSLRRQEHDNRIAEASRRFNSLVTTQRDLESQLQSFGALKDRCKKTLEQCEDDAIAIRQAWSDNQKLQIQWSEDSNICPTCGQYLPAEQIRARKEEAVRLLNEKKAARKAKLTADAEKVKATRSEAEKTMAEYDQKKAEAEKNLADIKEQINVVFSDKAKMEKEPILTYEQSLAESVQYVALSAQLKELQAKLDSVGIDESATQQLSDLEAKQVEYTAVLQQLNSQLSTRTQYDRILALIDGINEEQKDLVRQLSDLERKEDIARRYQDRQNAILEERINQHFSLVKWRMFRTVNNGGDPFDEPFCECYVDGVAYHDGLNQAARLNAGLDILNALCKHYNVSAPIVIDNSESSLNIIKTVGQQLRLEVFDSDLQII